MQVATRLDESRQSDVPAAPLNPVIEKLDVPARVIATLLLFAGVRLVCPLPVKVPVIVKLLFTVVVPVVAPKEMVDVPSTDIQRGGAGVKEVNSGIRRNNISIGRTINGESTVGSNCSA